MAIAGIVAGGTGSKMGNTVPKQFLPLCGRPVIVRTIEKFIGREGIDAVIVGVNPDWYDHMQSLISEYFPAGVYAARGGADRSDTIVNIIRYAIDDLGYDQDEILLTHDAVRPFVTEKMISDSINAMSHCEICTAAVGATDTMLISEDGQTASGFPLRSTMYRVQTPQTFRMGRFLSMLSAVPQDRRGEITDACSVFHRQGVRVCIIGGSESNIKLTFPADFAAAEGFIRASGKE